MAWYDFLKSMPGDLTNHYGKRGKPRCSRCGKPMTVISNEIVRTEVTKRAQGCFQCAACSRYTCYECSDNRQPCQCGQMQWQRRTYVP